MHDNSSVTNKTIESVSIIIVTFNSESVIEECLALLAEEPRFEIIVVDNASTDGTVDLVESRYRSVRIIRNYANVGFAKAVNKGVRECHGDHLLLLNPDAYISAGAVISLSKLMSKDSTLGACAPLVRDPNNEFTSVGAGHAPTIWRMFLHATGTSRLSRVWSFLEGHYLFRFNLADGPRYVDWASGGCLMVTSNAWRQVDGLSERWFMYGEDIDLCLRVSGTGLRIAIAPEISAVHEIGGSSSNVDGRINTLWITSLFDVYASTLSPSASHTFIWKLVVWAGFRGRALVYQLLARFTPHRPGAKIALANNQRYVAYAKALMADTSNDLK